MSATGDQSALIDSVKALLIGVAVLILTIFVWELLIAINNRLLVSIPVAAIGAIVYGTLLWSMLRPTWITRSLAFPRRLTASVWAMLLAGLFGCICLMIFLAAIWPYRLAAPERTTLATFQLHLSFAVVGPALAAFVEEIVFRGVIQPRLEKMLGVSVGILVCSLLFMLAHFANAEFSVQALFYFVASIYFGIVVWRTDSLCVPIAGHVALNVIGNSIVFFAGPVDSGDWSIFIVWLAGVTSLVSISVFVWLLWRDRVIRES